MGLADAEIPSLIQAATEVRERCAGDDVGSQRSGNGER